MAKGNTTLAIDPIVRDKLNRFVSEYNLSKGANEKELTAKDFISIAIDYFAKNNALNKLQTDSENWKDIHESDDKYQISDKGRVRRKSYIQEFYSITYENSENGLISKKKKVKRIYNERIITPTCINGKRGIKFSNGNVMLLSELMNKYWIL